MHPADFPTYDALVTYLAELDISCTARPFTRADKTRCIALLCQQGNHSYAYACVWHAFFEPWRLAKIARDVVEHFNSDEPSATDTLEREGYLPAETKAAQDALAYGLGVTRDGKHVPLKDMYDLANDRDAADVISECRKAKSINSHIEDLLEAVLALQKQVNDVNAKVSDMEARMERNESRVGSLDNSTDVRLRNLNERRADMENLIMGLRGDIHAHAAQITKLNILTGQQPLTPVSLDKADPTNEV